MPSGINIDVSRSIELGLEIGAGSNITSYNLGYSLSNNQAEFLWDGIMFPPALFDIAGETYNTSTMYGEISAAQLFGPPVEGPSLLMNGLVIRALEAGDIILTVTALPGTRVNSVDITAGTVLGTMTIHQIPSCLIVGEVVGGNLITQAMVDLWDCLGQPASWCYDCHSVGDFNGDCLIDAADIKVMVAGWRVYDPDCDTNNDGVIDADDIQAVITGWLEGCPSGCVPE
jgi:hypothetical protein